MKTTLIISLAVSIVNFEIKLLVIYNELQSLDNAKHLKTDSLKSLITHYTGTIESKFVNSWTIDNVSNFIFISNNYSPLRLRMEIGDMLYLKLVMNAKIILNILML
jgi:hypothetical protein